MSVKLSAEEMRYIALFESMTGATARDCVVDGDTNRLTFVVGSGDIGRAIGKGGSRVQRVGRAVGKTIDVVEYSDDPVEFIKNVLVPAEVTSVELVEDEGRKVARVKVEESSKGQAVGRGGKKIQRAKLLAARHHGISDVSLT